MSGETPGVPLARITEQIPSSMAGLYFTARIDGRWRWRTFAGDQLDPAALACHHLRERARAVLAQYPLQNWNAAQDALNARIGDWFNPGFGIQVCGIARLGQRARQRHRAARRQRVRDRADAEHQQHVQALRRLHQILADRDLRTAWLLDRYPHAPGVLDRLDHIEDHAAVRREPEEQEVHAAVSRFVDELLGSMSDPRQREIFLKVLMRALQEFGLPRLHAQARRWHQDVAGSSQAVVAGDGDAD